MPADDSDVEGWIHDLASRDGTVRHQARHRLIAAGPRSVGALIQALDDHRWHVRWEAAKALLEIRSPTAAPFLAVALMDKHADTRWVAAEALIALQDCGLEAVLKALIERADSSWFRESAHHVLHDLSHGRTKPVIEPVLAALDGPAPEDTAPVAADVALTQLSEHKP